MAGILAGKDAFLQQAFACQGGHELCIALSFMHAISVVAALLVRGNKIFVQKRPPTGALPNLWEFPGGKVERDESHREALLRECQEELGTAIRVGAHLIDIVTQTNLGELHLHLYWAELASPEATVSALAATEGRWLCPSELAALKFCPADVPVVAALVSKTLGLFGRMPADTGPSHVAP